MRPEPRVERDEGRERDPRLRGARRLAWWLDLAIPIPGTEWRVGLDPLVGLVPGLGDALGSLASVYVLVVAARLGAPRAVLARIALNLLADAALGAIPLVGDLFDFAFKANVRNLALLDAWLERPREQKRRSAALVAAAAVAAIAVLASILFAGWSLAAWAVRTIAR